MEFLLESMTNVEVAAAHIWSKGWHRDQLCPWLLSRLQALMWSYSWMNLDKTVKRGYQSIVLTYMYWHFISCDEVVLFSRVCVNACWCTCMWRPEVSLRWYSSGTITLLFWDRVLHWLETHQVDKPAWSATPGIHLSLPLQCWEYGCMPPHHLFYVFFWGLTLRFSWL